MDDPTKDETASIDDELVVEESGLLHHSSRTSVFPKLSSRIVSKYLAAVNITLTVILVITWVALVLSYQGRDEILKPPYSPLREDGAVKLVNKRLKPQKAFQQPDGPELDAAWNETMGPSDGIVRLPKVIADKLDRTSEIYYEPGYYIYGVNMFHQLHCLNIIRKTFYPEKYFPHKSEADLLFHKNHCFDFLRQSIQCSGDVSMTYWWNKNYTVTDDEGVEHYTSEYLNKSPKQRAYGTFLMWDVERQCRDLDAITDWVEKHQLRDGAYIKYIENKEDFIPGRH